MWEPASTLTVGAVSMSIYFNKSLSEIFDLKYNPKLDYIGNVVVDGDSNCHGENNPHYGLKHSDEWKNEASKRNIGEKNPMFGKKKNAKLNEIHRTRMLKNNPMWNEEVKRKNSLVRTGRKAKPETIQKMSDSLSKEWHLISPENELIKVKNLKKFCDQLGINVSNMHKVCTGKRKSYKGWKSKMHLAKQESI